MFVRLFLLLVLVGALMWFVSRLGRSTPQNRSKILKLGALYGGGIILLLLIVTGKLPALFALLVAAIPWIQRIIMVRSAYQTFKSFKGGPVPGSKPGQTSSVNSKILKMELNHDNGTITGSVLTGNYKGSSLDDLSIEQLAELMNYCRKKDAQSASLLETYLDRMRTDEWTEYVQSHADEQSTMADSDDMTREEALQVLGLEENASEQEIIEAHRVLMQRNHPDRGGSTWLAARINRAKDILLS